MRLIDADNISFYCNYEGDCTGDINDCKKCGNYICNFRDIQEQPTAYDIAKVVKELKTDSSVKLYGSQNSDNYMIPVNRAIEIVKQGVAGTETKIIRDKAIEWNNHSSKKVPYEFIDFVEGKREIVANDDVCEWKLSSDGEFIQNPHTRRTFSNESSMKNVYCNTCGKKIKVVE